jgi:polysaccharide export outer membrane protein
MPGMRNPDTASMSKISSSGNMKVISTLIPITTDLIANQNENKYIYHVAPSDILNITVWQHPEFSSQELKTSQLTNLPSTQGAAGQTGYLVNHNGYIYFPLIGNIRVANKTVDEIRIEMMVKLRKYIINPQINVRVVDFRSRKVYVLGEVNKPGFVPLNDQALSITDAIVLTGGLNPNAADPSHIYIIRGNIYRPNVYWLNANTPETLLLAEHFYLKSGDILYISSAPATRWNRVLNQLLPTIQTIWYTKAIIDSSNK